uniref:Glutathione hydrolase proenzyme n=1 Tax=Candidatus Kentrum sp. TUN TaxID=2126343 RepID=A0A451AD11_9GAMM|nr:MAG: gamma-glutamyltransferase 2. Threonine peptidase. MEROPS family T03 [Candidatus Kentron sp. TUN]
MVTPKSIAEATYDRPYGPRTQSRSVLFASNGIVATSHPLASQTGLNVLKEGGNAFDAAIAANAMLGLVEPMSCGIGGDLFALCWDAENHELHGLNASGRSPFSLSRDLFARNGFDQIPLYGPLSWSVPGCVDGWILLLERFGTRSLGDVLAPAIEYAESGFPVAEMIAGYWSFAEEWLTGWKSTAMTYLPRGRAPKCGEIFRNPHLATSYRKIAREGRDGFYRGSIAERIVAFSRRNGGYFDMRDFEEHTSEWVKPVSTDYRGYTVWELPPNGQGIAVLQMLNILESFDMASMGHNSAELLHLLIEAKKLAFADRAIFYADPAFGRLPIEELISKKYAERRQSRISPDRAAVDVPAGDPKLSHGDTIYLTVVDKDRNCCSLTQSIYHGFGSRVVPSDTGFALQNRGNLFVLDDTHPNRLEPHKRPFHTIIPGFVTRGGLPYFCFGVMGGDMQPQGQVQVLLNLIDFGMNTQAAGDAARLCHFGSQTPTGLAMVEGGGSVGIETGIPAESVEGLLRRGHRLIHSPGSFGGYQGILIDWENGVLHGATEPRKDGAAVGY